MTIDEYIEVLKLGEDTLDNENLLQLAEWLEELKIFKELYPDVDVKGSLVTNYNNGWNDCLKFLSDHLEEFHNTLQAGQYDYFPDDDIGKYLKSLMKVRFFIGD